MAHNPDLSSSISAAQREVDSWESRAKLASSARAVGPRWPLTIIVWAALALAMYAERDLFGTWFTPHDSSETLEQISDVLSHTAEDIETYRAQFGELPDTLPIDFLNGWVTYVHEGTNYTLETTYHGNRVRLQADASGPGTVEVVTN
jgi:hypothetical protein